MNRFVHMVAIHTIASEPASIHLPRHAGVNVDGAWSMQPRHPLEPPGHSDTVCVSDQFKQVFGQVLTLTVDLPSLDKNGNRKKIGKKGTVVTVTVDVPGLRK